MHKNIGTKVKADYWYPWKEKKEEERVGEVMNNLNELISLTIKNYKEFIKRAEEIY